MKYKLICIDLDGTLLNSNKSISDENKSAIKDAINKGVKIVICSGRIFSGAMTFARELEAKGPIISCNGALIKDIETNEIIFSNYMNSEDCKRIIEICHKYKIYFHIYIDETLYTEKLKFSSLFYWNKNKTMPESQKVDIKLVKDIFSVIDKNKDRILKFVVISNEDQILNKCRCEVELINSVTVTSSSSNNFEVMNYGVDKGIGIKIIADRLDISKNEIISIGDNENDIQMFNYSGVKVAMGNAHESVKKISDYITLTNDDNGVAHMIKKYILN